MSPWRPWQTDNRDQRARFEQWVEAHTQPLFAFAYRLCGSRELSDELVQETFYQAWKSIDRLREPEKARAWLMQILRHRYARWARQQQRRSNAHAAIGAGANGSPAAEDPTDQLAHRDTLQQALDQLPEHYRLVFVLVFVGGLSCEEAASELDVPLGTVLSRLHRARQRLREAIGKLDKPPAPVATLDPNKEGKPYLRLGGEA